MSKCAWESLEAILETAEVLFGKSAPEVATILLIQLFAFADLHQLPDGGQKRYARAAQHKCERLQDLAGDPRAVFASGWVEMPWCEGDASMRYDATLLRAEATQHLANVIASGGDNQLAEETRASGVGAPVPSPPHSDGPAPGTRPRSSWPSRRARRASGSS